jgi:uncharacterized protein with HEPN domain
VSDVKINPDLIRLLDIKKAILEIAEFYQDGLDDRKTIMAISYSIAIIGEAANKLSAELTTKHNHVPWKKIVGMRHRIIHDYGNVDIENLNQAVAFDLPKLALQIDLILKNF